MIRNLVLRLSWLGPEHGRFQLWAPFNKPQLSNEKVEHNVTSSSSMLPKSIKFGIFFIKFHHLSADHFTILLINDISLIPINFSWFRRQIITKITVINRIIILHSLQSITFSIIFKCNTNCIANLVIYHFKSFFQFLSNPLMRYWVRYYKKNK